MKRDELTEKIKEIIQNAGPVKILIVILSGVLLLLISCGNLFEKKETNTEKSVSIREESEPGTIFRIIGI